MAEELLTIFKETSVSYIGANAFLEATFHSFKLVSMISRASELESAWHSATLMATKEMLKFGYQLGKGLSAIGHRKAALIELPDNKGGFGLRYNPHQGQGMSIPHIKVTFSTPAKVIRLATT